MKKEHELLSDTKVAWLIPSMERGFCWLPVLEKFANIFPDTTVYTGLWPWNQSIDNLKYKLNIIGKTRFLRYGKNDAHYDKGIIIPPLYMPFHLLKFSPKVIITHAFSFWTVLALLHKPLMGWRVIIAYDGSSPTVDARQSTFRTFGRKLMTLLSDSLITNSHSGKSYLVQFLKAKEELVFVRPYLVPDIKNLSEKKVDVKKMLKDAKRPLFLYVGLLIQRKGLQFLIESFAALKRKGYEDFTLVIAGDGPERQEVENMVCEAGIQKQVKWIGWIDYSSLGCFFDSSDVFVFPTLEDTWGLVVLEAMAFGKPVLCSELAGAMEMIKDGKNGYRFNPARDNPEVLSNILMKFIDDPGLIRSMGETSKKMVSPHTPETAANHMKHIIEFVLGWKDRGSMELSEHTQKQS